MKKRVLTMMLAGILVLGSLPQMAFAGERDMTGEGDGKNSEAVLPYQDISLTFEERAADLVSRMTLDEKALQMITSSAAAIPRLGVAQYNYWSEGLHGVARSGEATSFPHGLGIASTWNKEMVLQMGTAISDEARGYANGKGKGLSYWNPTINLARDPRWGRAEEGYGEDPYLTSVLGENCVNGMQGDDETYLKTIATLKHFVANNSEYNRHTGSSDVDDRDLREYYSYTFKNIVENTEVASVMSSYNQLNGIPMPANSFMLTDVLRNTWGFDGYVTSDCGAIYDIWGNHKWQPEGMDRVVNSVEATGLAVKAGTDINCGSQYHVNLKQAVEQGIITEDDVDKALIRLFTARMKTGEFDPEEKVPYKSEVYSYENQVESEEHKQLAEDMADEAIILLKNEAILPLNAERKKIVVVGELAQRCIQGDYSAAPSEEHKSTPIEGIRAAAKRAGSDIEVTYIDNYGVKDVSSYLLNVKGFELGYDTHVKQVQASEADGYKACRIESNSNKNFGYISSGAYAVYKNVDVSGLKRFSVEAAGAKADAYSSTVELHLDAPDGQVIASVEPGYSSGWQNYETTGVDVNGTFDGTHDLYLTFTYRASDVSFTAKEEQQIADADAVIVVAGTRTIDGEGAIGSASSDSAEEKDRETLDFPRNQAGSILKCAELNSNTVVCIQAVGQMNVEPFKDEVKAITWSTYNGQAQGNALGRILYGEKNPSAKLTFSWYTSLYELGDIGDYGIRSGEESNGRTYQYFTGNITYPFGYGLSYTDFAYSDLKIDKTSATTDDQIQVSVRVTNIGDTEGQEVVQMYVVSPDAASKGRPVKRLKGFEKTALKAGESKVVHMTLETDELAYWSEDKFDYDLGTYEIQISTSSADEDIQGKQSFQMTEKADPKIKTVTLTGKAVFDETEMGTPVKTELTAALCDDSFCKVSEEIVVYKSSDEAVARVDEDGMVTAVGFGTAVITAEIVKDGATKSGSYAVAVQENVKELYYISSRADQNQVVAVDGGRTTSGTQLIEWENNKGGDQQWLLKKAGDDTFYFVNSKSNFLMSAQDLKKDSVIVQNEVVPGDMKQLWRLEESTENGVYWIVNAASGYVLSRGPRVASTIVSPIIQTEKDESNAENQLWNLNALTEQFIIMSETGEGGSISPSGRTAVVKGGSRMYTILPEEGYRILDVKVDGVSVGAVNEYWFRDVQADKEVKATFEKVGDLPFEDVKEDDWFIDDVRYVFEKKIMTGLDPAHFGSAENLSRAQFVTVLYRMEGSPDVAYEPVFKDVQENAFYSKAVVWANQNGIVTGYEGTDMFGTVDNITREQMAVMMFRYTKYKGYDTQSTGSLDQFPDGGDTSGFAKEAMSWAVSRGLIFGNGDKMLVPLEQTNRIQCAAVIRRFDSVYKE